MEVQMELFKAHNQWKTRPADERFETLSAMRAACVGYKEAARIADVPYSNLRVEAQGEDIALVGRTGVPASLTNWAFGQLAARAKAPASYLRELPATLAAQNINYGLKERATQNSTDKASLMFHANGSLVVRSVLSEDYTRIWNADIVERLVRFQESSPNWKNPLAYKVLEVGKDGKWPVMSSEMAPAGLYASDHDMFAFLVDESKTIEGSPSGLNRGFFVWNSEVGASSFGIMTFLYDRVCGNNIVWGASNVVETRLRHVGKADSKAWGTLAVDLIRYANSSTSDVDAMIESAKKFELGKNKLEVIDGLLSIIAKARITDLPKARVVEAIDLAEQRTERYGRPNTMWAAVGGLTEASQFKPHADERMKIDRAAGKLLKTIQF